MTIVILCGGAGTRLWPLSRKERPKQFAAFVGTETLFESTVRRNLPLAERFIIVTNRDHLELAREQFEKAAATSDCAGGGAKVLYILEPVGRNTAPAIALAALSAEAGEVLLVVPSDHAIADEGAYREAARKAERGAVSGRLVTFGIEPAGPETGYGYIESGEELDGGGLFAVTAFHEKPSMERAEEYLRAGRFYWNSGMFAFTREAILQELSLAAPAILAGSEKALAMAPRSSGVVKIDEEAMRAIPSDSIDYAVIEKSECVATLPAEMGWSDLGSYDAIYEIREKDASGNAASPGSILVEASNCLVLSSGRRIALAGVEDLVVVEDGDSILITKRGRTQIVKDVTARL